MLTLFQTRKNIRSSGTTCLMTVILQDGCVILLFLSPVTYSQFNLSSLKVSYTSRWVIFYIPPQNSISRGQYYSIPPGNLHPKQVKRSCVCGSWSKISFTSQSSSRNQRCSWPFNITVTKVAPENAQMTSAPPVLQTFLYPPCVHFWSLTLYQSQISFTQAVTPTMIFQYIRKLTFLV